MFYFYNFSIFATDLKNYTMKIKRYQIWTRDGLKWSAWFKWNGKIEEKWQIKNKQKNEYKNVTIEEWKKIEKEQEDELNKKYN